MKNIKNFGISGAVLLIVSFCLAFILQFPFVPTFAGVLTIATVQHVIMGAQSEGVLSMALLGFVKGCSERSGGVSSLYLAKVTDVEAFTLGTAADITKFATVAMANGAFFQKYEFQRDTVEYKESSVRENGSYKVTKSLEFMLPKMDQNSRDVVEEIAVESNCGLIAIVVDNNGLSWVVGYTVKHKKDKPLELATGEATTGKALTDANGETVILTVEDTEKARTFTGVIPIEV